MSPPKKIHEIKSALLAGEILTQIIALEREWGWRLAAAIHYLKKQCGWVIENLEPMGCPARYILRSIPKEVITESE